MHFIFKSYLHNFYAIFPRYLCNICQILPDITIIQTLVLTGSPKILKFSAEMEKRVHAQECSLQEVGVPPSARVQRWRGQRFWCAGVVVDPELLLFGNEVTTATKKLSHDKDDNLTDKKIPVYKRYPDKMFVHIRYLEVIM